MNASYPHYHLVPKDYLENLLWRRAVLLEAARSKKFAKALHKLCSEDILFYFNFACWTFDPRDQDNPHKPFITYGFQDEAIHEICEAIRVGRDMAIPKSRCMGASWIILTVFEYHWHFRDGLSFLMGSRNEDYVDKLEDPKSLFWKIDYLHRRQPRWLLGKIRNVRGGDPLRKKLHLGNGENGSVINGESATGDFGRGDRGIPPTRSGTTSTSRSPARMSCCVCRFRSSSGRSLVRFRRR